MRFRIALIVAAVLAIAAPTSAQAHHFRSFFGPPLQTPPAQLAAALSCPQSLHHLKKDPVLLVPGTGLTGPDTYSWNYAITLPQAGYAYCIVTLPQATVGDIPTATEYVVFAIRAMALASGRQVDMLGFSQGGL